MAQGWSRDGAGMEQGWRSGESARLPPMWPRFDSWTRRHMWVEFVVGSLLWSLLSTLFSGYSSFPLSSETNISKFQFDPRMHGHILNEFLRTPRCSMGKQITFTFTSYINRSGKPKVNQFQMPKDMLAIANKSFLSKLTERVLLEWSPMLTMDWLTHSLRREFDHLYCFLSPIRATCGKEIYLQHNL